jgi:hypothetical protein
VPLEWGDMDQPNGSRQATPVAGPAVDEKTRRIGNRLIAVAIAVLLLIVLSGGVAVWKLTHRPPELIRVASFRADYQEGNPGSGWQYLWNPTAEIGKTDAYRPLVCNGVRYGSDENPNFPRPEPGAYVRLSRHGGHPGRGKTQRGTFDIYVIVGFTVTNQGYYSITNSSVRRHDGDFKGDIMVRVFINEQPAGPELLCSSKPGQPFDRVLGELKANDTVYVAVGPNGADTNDQFDLDFNLVMIPSKQR